MCTNACPADVKIAEMNNRARAQLKAGHRPRFRDWLLGQTDFVGRMGVLTAPIANWSFRFRPFRTLIELLRRDPPPRAAAGLRLADASLPAGRGASPRRARR